MKDITITVTGKAKSGKSTIASSIDHFLAPHCNAIHLNNPDVSPTDNLSFKHIRKILKTVNVVINMKQIARQPLIKEDSMKFNPQPVTKPHQTEIHTLDYGTVICDVSGGGNPGLYIKVNKQKLGANLGLTWTKNHCVIMNLNYGTLREIKACTIVTVADSTLNYHPTHNIHAYTKDECIRCNSM